MESLQNNRSLTETGLFLDWCLPLTRGKCRVPSGAMISSEEGMMAVGTHQICFFILSELCN